MINQTIAHYRITSKLGQGGMGEVYRATDTKLDRDVAIKVLPKSFAEDRDRLARFEREAKVLAALNHPNIAVIYGIEQSVETRALIMELAEGETLAERLRREPMTVPEALDCCKQIAEALEAAHEKGIIHRDLKPENVKITPDGRVKVLDFGLAKEVIDPASSLTQEDSPTITHLTTLRQELLGTASYMSPEQARARQVDKRSDIWSFGCVLYECLTGKTLFQGEDVTDTLATVIKSEPDWDALPADTPPTVELLLRKCLAKDRKRRLRDIGDARIDLEQALGDPGSAIMRLSDQALRERLVRVGVRRKWLLAIVVGVALLTAHLTWFIKPVPAPVPPQSRHSELLVSGSSPLTTSYGNNGFALSPDGSRLIYNLDDEGEGLRIRDLGTGQDEAIHGAASNHEGHPFFAPDGRRFGCVLGGNLCTLLVSGGTPRKLVELDRGWSRLRGADWSEKGTIVFATLFRGLRVVREDGGTPEAVTELKEGEFAHAYPQFLPGGTHILFLVIAMEGGSLVGNLEVVDIATRQRQKLGIEGCRYARYSRSGHLLYAQGGGVFAIAFDPERLKTKGTPKRVLEGVRVSGGWRAQFDVAEDGTLVYLTGEDSTSPKGTRTLAWIDANDRTRPFTKRSGPWNRFDLSPDEKRVALEIDHDIWILEKIGEDFEQLRPLVRGEPNESAPCWSRDGKSIYFASDREGKSAIWRMKADYSDEPAELILESTAGRVFPDSVSESDLMIVRITSDGGELLRLALHQPGAKPEPFLKKEGVWFFYTAISPDGKWLAYNSASEGVDSQIYLRSMDGSTASVLVSDGEGFRPRWSRAGDHVFYRRRPNFLSTALVQRDDRLVPEKPSALLRFDWIHDFEWTLAGEQDQILALVEADTVFAENTERPEPNEPTEPTHLRIVTNWFTELNELVPPAGVN